jgi:hypothetical protein
MLVLIYHDVNNTYCSGSVYAERYNLNRAQEWNCMVLIDDIDSSTGREEDEEELKKRPSTSLCRLTLI